MKPIVGEGLAPPVTIPLYQCYILCEADRFHCRDDRWTSEDDRRYYVENRYDNYFLQMLMFCSIILLSL